MSRSQPTVKKYTIGSRDLVLNSWCHNAAEKHASLLAQALNCAWKKYGWIDICRSNFEKGAEEPGTVLKASHAPLDSCIFQQILLRVRCRSGIMWDLCICGKVILYQCYQKHREAFDGEFAATGQEIEGTPPASVAYCVHFVVGTL